MVTQRITAALLGLGSALLAVQGCAPFEETVCADYACGNAARLTGDVALPEGTETVTVEYCSEVECVKSRVDVGVMAAGAACDVHPYDDAVCLEHREDGKLRVKASLRRGDDGTLPPDGEQYTLTIVDEASGTVLVEESRKADYETTQRDACHWCWSSEMTL